MTTRLMMQLLRELFPKDVSMVCSLGRTAEEANRCFPSETLFLDSMGDVLPVACGVALGLSGRPVAVLDTDGSHLFGLASLPVVGALASRLSNLTVIVVDNGQYESAGGLPSRFCSLDWTQLGAAVGVVIRTASTEADLRVALTRAFSELTYVVVTVANPDEAPAATKALDGIESRYRFIRRLERLTEQTILRPATKS